MKNEIIQNWKPEDAAFWQEHKGFAYRTMVISLLALHLAFAVWFTWKIKNEWIQEGQQALDKEEQRLNALEVKNIEKVIRHGKVADEIVAIAKERNADLIILASQKRSPLGKLLMGSHTYELFTKAPCPIFRIVR